MTRAILTVALSDGITQAEGKAIRDAIMQLRGVEAVTANTQKPAERIIYQRMKQRAMAAIEETLNNLDTEGEINGEQDEAQLGRE